MKKLWLLLALAALGCNRTEIVIGVVTDIEAPDSVDTVVLSAEREGVQVLSYTWPISGIPNQPFELPGSFGVYSSDGTPVKVTLEVAGLKGNQIVVKRQSIVSLVKGKTLFLRMSLVQRCMQTECEKQGLTCIEGACRDPLVDEKTLPDFAPEMVTSVACSSGTVFVNTSTKKPLPMSGAGDCAADEQCGEGTCYKIPQDQLAAVQGTQAVTWVDEKGERLVPTDLSQQKVQALTVDGSGTWKTYPGSGKADGSFTVGGVPNGPYYLQIGSDYYLRSARVLDLGSTRLGRPDLTPISQGVQYSFTLQNVAPWDPRDIIEMFTPAVTTAYVYASMDVNGMSPATGATSLTNFVVGSNDSDLTEAAKGDQAYLVQLHTTSDAQGVTYQSVTRYLEPPLYTTMDGATTPIRGSFTDVTLDQAYTQGMHTSSWLALAQQASPHAQQQNLGVDLLSEPGKVEYGNIGANIDLCTSSPPTSPPKDVVMTCMHGSPLPAKWVRFAVVFDSFEVDYQLPGAMAPFPVVTTVQYGQDPAKLDPQALTDPLITPARGVTVDGEDFFSDRQISATPTFKWSAPDRGAPTHAMVSCNPLSIGPGGGTRRGSPVRVNTVGNSVTFPPGALQVGTPYACVLALEVQGGVSGERQPNRSGIPFGFAPALSGLLTVGGAAPSPDGGTGGMRDAGIGPPDLGAGPADAGVGPPPDGATCLPTGTRCMTNSQCCNGVCNVTTSFCL